MTLSRTGTELGRTSHALRAVAQDLVVTARAMALDAQRMRETLTHACDASRLECERSREIRAARGRPLPPT